MQVSGTYLRIDTVVSFAVETFIGVIGRGGEERLVAGRTCARAGGARRRRSTSHCRSERSGIGLARYKLRGSRSGALGDLRVGIQR